MGSGLTDGDTDTSGDGNGKMSRNVQEASVPRAEDVTRRWVPRDSDVPEDISKLEKSVLTSEAAVFKNANTDTANNPETHTLVLASVTETRNVNLSPGLHLTVTKLTK